jgi:hypothetical protein
MKSLVFTIISAIILSASAGYCTDIRSHRNGIWSIKGTELQNRWIVIHHLSDGLRSGIYHIEVLGRGKKAHPWDVDHLVDHMAVTEGALLKSIIKPLKKGAVYPESFDGGYKMWLDRDEGEGRPVCDTSIEECMAKMQH